MTPRTMMKVGLHMLTRIALPLFGLLCLLALIQTGMALRFAQGNPRIEGADLVVVFPGDQQRVATGLAAVKEGLAPSMMVISTPAAALQEIFRKNGIPATTQALPGDLSRSTFEDVYHTAQAIRANQLDSIIVVSSSYHLPRALTLLRLYLTFTGADARIQGLSVNEEHRPTLQPQHYNEVVKFWGSLVEMGGYFFRGGLVLDVPQAKQVQMVLKDNLLWKGCWLN
jgi:hypothetical protein